MPKPVSFPIENIIMSDQKTSQKESAKEGDTPTKMKRPGAFRPQNAWVRWPEW